MKKIFIIASFCISEVVCNSVVGLRPQYTPKNAKLNNAFNTLKSVEVASDEKGFATWATLSFSGPCKPKKVVSKSEPRVSIFFPSLKLGVIDQEAIFKSLNKFNVIERLQFKYITKPVTGVLLDIKFVDKGAMVKLIHTGDLNKLMIIVYSKDKLKKINQSTGAPLLLAHSSFLEQKKKKNTKLRVMLDPGHGGKARGAKGFFNLVEKDVTLDIARKVKTIFESMGFEVALTRNNDKDVSLVERYRMSERFNADLFISIHANSAGNAEKASGIETYHVDGRQFVGAGNVAASYDFLFVDSKEDEQLAHLADSLIRNREGLSHKLADSIQNTLVDMLQTNKIAVKDRGVKKAAFINLVGHLLCRNNDMKTPSVLVEVGFISNKEEAKRLTDSSYRRLLAYGICKGVRNFLVRG